MLYHRLPIRSILTLSSLGALFGAQVLFAQTFTPPTDFPPKANVEPPINTSTTAQEKKGQLTVSKLCLKTVDPANCKDVWPTGGLTSMPTLQDVTDKGKSTSQTVQLKGGIQGTQTDKWALTGNTASTDSPFIEFWGASNADAARRGELTLGSNSATGRIKFYNYNGSWKPPLLTITPGGNVGIGTGDTDPTQRLEVKGTAKVDGLQLATGAGAGKVLTSDASGTGAWASIPAQPVTWGGISGFPAGCASGQYVESIGGTLTCKSLPTKTAWSSLTFPTCASGYAVGFYTDTGDLDCGAPVNNALTGSGNTSTIAQFTGTNTLGNSVIIDRTNFPVVGAGTVYVGGYPAGSLTRDLSVSRDLIVSGTMTKGSVPWARLSTFPTACPAGQYASGVGSSLTCGTPSGSGGASLPAGTTGQTLRHNGTAWVADGVLKNDGTKVVVAATSADNVAIDVGGGGVPKKIANVATPTGTSDAATKGYVDAQVSAQTTSSPNIVTYTSYGVGTNATRGANAPVCQSGWTELFAGWGPLTGEVAYTDLIGSGGSIGGSGISSRLKNDYSGNRSFLNELLGGIQSIMGEFSMQGSVSVAPTVGGIPVMPSCIDLPTGSNGPQGLAVFLGNEKDYLPGDSYNNRSNWTIGAMVPSGLHVVNNNTVLIYNSCRICYKKIP